MDCYKNAQLFLAVTAKWLFIYWQFCVSGQKEEGKSQWEWVTGIQTRYTYFCSWGSLGKLGSVPGILWVFSFHSLFNASWLAKWSEGKEWEAHFFFLITFWNLSVVVIKTWRGLMRRNTDNKISFALFQIHTLWLITIVLSIKTLGYAWCAVHHMQCKAQYLWMFSELAFFIKVFVLLVSQLKEMMF